MQHMHAVKKELYSIALVQGIKQSCQHRPVLRVAKKQTFKTLRF